MKIFLNTFLLLLCCVSIYPSNKKNGMFNNRKNITIGSKIPFDEANFNSINHSYIFSANEDSSVKKCITSLDPALIHKNINSTFDKFSSDSSEFKKFLFYEKENENLKLGKHIFPIKIDNGYLIFDECKSDKNLYVLENCIVKIPENKKNNIKECSSFYETIVFDSNEKKSYEYGFYLQSSNDFLEYGYKNKKGFIYSVKPIKFTDDLINKISAESNNKPCALNISSNIKTLSVLLSNALTKRYKKKENFYDYDIEEQLNNNVDGLLEKVDSFLGLANNYNGCTKMIYKNIKNWVGASRFSKFLYDSNSGELKEENISFSELEKDEFNEYNVKKNFKFRLLVEYFNAFDKFCRLGKCKVCEKGEECKGCSECSKYKEHKKDVETKQYMSFLVEILSKYFYIFDLNCYKDTDTEEFFKKNNLFDKKNELSNFILQETDISILDLFSQYIFNPINGKTEYQNIYNYIIFCFKYDSSDNFFLKKSLDKYIPDDPFRYIDSCLSGLHFALTPENEMYDLFKMETNKLNDENIIKKLGINDDILNRLQIELELRNMPLKENKEFLEKTEQNNSRISQNNLKINRKNIKKKDKKKLKSQNDKLKQNYVFNFAINVSSFFNALENNEKKVFFNLKTLDKIKDSFTNINFEEIEKIVKTESLHEKDNLDIPDNIHIIFSGKSNSINFIFCINDKNENCKKNSSFSIKSNSSRFAYQNGDKFQLYNFSCSDNNEICFDKNEIKDNDEKEIKSIMSTLYGFNIETSHTLAKDNCFYDYLCRHSFSSIFCLLNNGDYNYANLSVCNYINDKPLIAFKRNKMFFYGRLKEFLYDNITNKDCLFKNILSILSYDSYYDYPVANIITTAYPFTIVFFNKYYFIHKLNDINKIYSKDEKGCHDITDNNLNFIINLGAKISGSENLFNCRLIYNPDSKILKCDYIKYIEKDKESSEKKIDIFELLKLIDKKSILEINNNLSNVVKKFSKIRNLANDVINKKNEFKGITEHNFNSLIKDIKNNNELSNNFCKSTFKIIDKIELDDIISYDSLIFFLWMHCNVDVDKHINEINTTYKQYLKCKKNIIFKNSLTSKKNVIINSNMLLKNIPSYSIIDQLNCCNENIEELYYYLILLSSGYTNFKINDKLVENLEGTYHFAIKHDLRIYFTFDDNNIYIFNYVGHLLNKEETAKKSGGETLKKSEK